MYLNYGECPNCHQMTQPPDMRQLHDDVYIHNALCCDCKISWVILEPFEIADDEPWMHTYEITDVEPFAGWKPYDCRERKT